LTILEGAPLCLAEMPRAALKSTVTQTADAHWLPQQSVKSRALDIQDLNPSAAEIAELRPDRALLWPIPPRWSLDEENFRQSRIPFPDNPTAFSGQRCDVQWCQF